MTASSCFDSCVRLVLRPGHRDRRRARALGGAAPARGPATTAESSCRRRCARAPDGPLSAILLLSDGAQTRGKLAPLEGAQRAKSYGIPVYTVALGTPGGVLRRGGFARPVPPDPVTLRQIAQATGGEFFAPRARHA